MGKDYFVYLNDEFLALCDQITIKKRYDGTSARRPVEDGFDIGLVKGSSVGYLPVDDFEIDTSNNILYLIAYNSELHEKRHIRN